MKRNQRPESNEQASSDEAEILNHKRRNFKFRKLNATTTSYID